MRKGRKTKLGKDKNFFHIEIHSANPNSNKISERMEGVSKDNH